MLLQGDCLDRLKELEDNSVDSIVTDPPYGLSFMSKKWDYDVPSTAIWEECLRVLKPGGHLLSFSSARTYHRMVVNVEDAGFEIRDQIMWVYGSGFPKNHNIGKSVDKLLGNEREVIGEGMHSNIHSSYLTIHSVKSPLLSTQSVSSSATHLLRIVHATHPRECPEEIHRDLIASIVKLTRRVP